MEKKIEYIVEIHYLTAEGKLEQPVKEIDFREDKNEALKTIKKFASEFEGKEHNVYLQKYLVDKDDYEYLNPTFNMIAGYMESWVGHENLISEDGELCSK